MAEDGLGTAADELESADGEIEQRFFPEPNDEGETTGDEEKIPEWMAGLDEETREWATKAGVKDPAAAVRSMREAQRTVTQAREEAARERQRAEQVEAYLSRQGGQPTGQPTGQQATDAYVERVAQIGQAYDEGQINSAQAEVLRLEAYREMMREDRDAAVRAAVEPIAGKQQEAELERAAYEMSRRYSDFEDLSGDVIRLLNEHAAFRDPAFRDSAAGIEAAYGIVQSQRAQERAIESERASRAETLNSGSRGRTSKSAEQAIRERIANAHHRPNDGL